MSAALLLFALILVPLVVMLLSRLLCAYLCLLPVLCAPARAQTLDRFPDLWSTDLRVEGMALLGDTLFATGLFRNAGPSTGQLAVLDKTTGEADTSSPPFNAIIGSQNIKAIVPDGEGGYYVGGEFTSVAEQPRRNLAHVLPDGTLDPNFRPDPQFSGRDGAFVGELALDGGVLYLAGLFDTVRGQARRDLAAVDAVTGAALPFDGAIGGDSGGALQIFELHARAGVVYVGGLFTTVAGQPRPDAVALDGTTGALLPWSVSTNASVLPLGFGDGTVYIRGAFDQINGQPRPGTAEVSLYDLATGGGAVTAWTPSERLFGTNFVVAGNYIWAPGPSGPALYRANRTSGAVSVILTPGVLTGGSAAFDPVGGPSGQGVLYLGGQAAAPGSTSSTPFPVVVGLDVVTGQPTGYRVDGASERSRVKALAVEPGAGGRLFAGGNFTVLSTSVVRRQGLAAFDLTTGRPTDFAEGLSGPGQGLFEDLALSPDGRFLYGYSNIVGGAALDLTEFDLVTGATRQFIPQGLTAATYAASAHVIGASQDRRASARATETRTAPNPRVENAQSGVLVTDTRVCVSLAGVVCYDRVSAELLFYSSMVYVGAGGGDNGDLLYLPPGGPFGNPGGPDGAIILAAPVEEAPVGTVHPAFVAVDLATGAVIGDWDVGFIRRPGAIGFAGTMLDLDGPGPAEPLLYLGGSFSEPESGPIGSRKSLVAADPVTGAAQPWAATVSGGDAAALAMASHRTVDGRGVVYVGGTLFFANGVRRPRGVVAFDAASGALLPWEVSNQGVPLVLLLSERLGAVFVGGSVGLEGTGHANLVALTPAAPILATAGEAGGLEAAIVRASVSLAGPNPLRSRTALAVSLPEAQAVQASLYDVLGRRVAVLHDGALPAGTSRIDVDASALPAGVYVARMVAGTFTEALTLTVVR